MSTRRSRYTAIARRVTKLPIFYIQNRDGLYLLDTLARPFVWNARRGASFSSRSEAQGFINRHFVGPVAARELGLRVVDGRQAVVR